MLLVVLLSPWKMFAANALKEKLKIKREKISSLFSHDFIRYVILVAVPLNIGLMFIVAFFPSFISSMGLPGVTTSYGYLVNGLIGIYIGPRALRMLSQKLGRTTCVVIALLLAASAMFVLNIAMPLVVVMLSVALLGLFDGYGTPAAGDYYVNLPFVERVGTAKALSVLNVIGGIIQVFSPMLYSVILNSGLLGTNLLGIGFVIAAVIFAATIGKKNKANI